MDQLVFRGKRQKTSGKYVSITLRKNNDVAFTLRNECFKKISPHTGCFGYAISGSRIYFCEFKEGDGYKFSLSKDGDSAYVHFKGRDYDDLIDFAKKHAGNYDLTYDSKYQKFCVETNLLFKGKHGNVL